jgi:hypothetical protein
MVRRLVVDKVNDIFEVIDLLLVASVETVSTERKRDVSPEEVSRLE